MIRAFHLRDEQTIPSWSMEDHSFVAANVIVPLRCMIDVFRNQLAGATEMIQILYYHYKI